MTFNGWQRIWVVFAVCWVGGVSVNSVLSIPSDDKVYYDWSRDLTAYLLKQAPDLKDYSVESLRGAYADMPDRQLIDALRDKYIQKHPAYQYGFDQVAQKYQERLSGTRTHLYWVQRAGLALGLPVTIYIAGWSVAWIRRGFTKQPSG